MINQLKTIIAQQEAANATLEKEVETLAAQLQRINDELKLRQVSLLADNQ